MLKATAGKGLDVTVDMLSGPTVNQTMRCTAIKGRIVNIGRLAGMTADFDFDLHARKRIEMDSDLSPEKRAKALKALDEAIAEVERERHDD